MWYFASGGCSPSKGCEVNPLASIARSLRKRFSNKGVEEERSDNQSAEATSVPEGSPFSADAPIGSAQQDRLNRAPFARRIAEAILSWETETSIVVGVYGEWGSGKSSILNLAVDYLERSTESLPQNQRPLVIRFNAWGFSQHDQIVSAFFNTISFRLEQEDSTGAARGVARRIQAYSALLAPVQFAASWIHPGLGGLAKGARTVMERAGKALEGMADLLDKDSEAVKSQINELLRSRRQRIVVVIDDIDRLSKEEIRQVFQLLKNNADFAYMIYLVALDAGVVGEALESLYGPNFLEKIVQVQVPVPRPDEQEVLRVFYEGIDELQKKTGTEYTAEQFLNLFLRGPSRWLRHMRDVTRYLNALRFSVPLVKHDVHMPDFIVVEGMRLFRAKTHAAIQTYKSHLIGEESTTYLIRRQSTWFTAFKEDCAEEWDSVEELVEELFPLIQSHTRGVKFGTSYREDWSREKRVTSPDHFDVYFSFSISSRAVSEVEFRMTLTDIVDPVAFREHALRMRDTGRMRLWLRKLYELARDLSNPEAAVHTLLSVGDLMSDDDGAFADPPSSSLLLFAARRTIETLPPHERYELILRLIGQDVDLFSAARLVAYETEETKEAQPGAMGKLEVTRLKDTIVKRIKGEADDGRLIDRAHLPGLVSFWLSWGEEDDVSSFLRHGVTDYRLVPKLLPVFVSIVRVVEGGSLVTKREVRGQPVTLRLVDLSELQHQLARVSDDTLDALSDEQRQVVDFLKSLDAAGVDSMGEPLAQRIQQMQEDTAFRDAPPPPQAQDE